MAQQAKRGSVLQKPLPSTKTVSASSFAFLFAELISYYRSRSAVVSDLEARLDAAGYGIGVRFLELLSFREKPGKREIGVVNMLQFLSSTVWQQLFGKNADALEKSTDTANAYMIRDDEPLTNYFISMPRELSRLNPASFMAGIIRGVLDSAGFPCTVQAVIVPTETPRDKTVFLIKFEAAVAAREG